jgi:amidophosphoribosyltransferase
VNLEPFDPSLTDVPKEECGVVGIFSPGREASRLAFFSLFALQHRGQESAGIAVSNGTEVHFERDMGLVSQVFNEETLQKLPGHLAVGHTRYSTTGPSVLRNAQPIYCQSMVGEIAVAHNGNLINTDALREELIAEGEHLDSTSDSELIARIFLRHMKDGPEAAVREVMRRCEGAYSCTVLTKDMVVGFRDPYGVRPLVIGRLGDGYAIASESCALAPIDAHVIRELDPGEMAIIQNGNLRFAKGANQTRSAMCMFEFIYFARPDSEMYGTMLYSARERMGMNLAKEHPVEADVVVPVPDSGIPAALGYAEQSGIPFREGMTKSRYIHRTFIAPDPVMRKLGVRLKLSPLIPHIRGKRVILVDDSIVRATTTGQIVKLMFQAGAKEVHVRITAPPIMWPCFYGIDMASRKELAAAVMTIEEIRQHIGATSLGYLSVPGVVEAVGRPENEFCLACFTGNYPIAINDPAVLEDKVRLGEMAAVPMVPSS